MAEQVTKIDIFSGFLGAGKTTLIKKLIKEAFQGEKIVLIENEFGEIGIDIQATYFQKSWKNPLIGQYHTLSGTVEFFDPSVHLRIDDTEIQIQDICDLTGDVFETIEISC